MKNRCLYCYEPLSEGERITMPSVVANYLERPKLRYCLIQVTKYEPWLMRSFVRRPLLQEYNLSSLRWKYSGIGVRKKKLQNSVSIIT